MYTQFIKKYSNIALAMASLTLATVALADDNSLVNSITGTYNGYTACIGNQQIGGRFQQDSNDQFSGENAVFYIKYDPTSGKLFATDTSFSPNTSFYQGFFVNDADYPQDIGNFGLTSCATNVFIVNNNSNSNQGENFPEMGTFYVKKGSNGWNQITGTSTSIGTDTQANGGQYVQSCTWYYTQVSHTVPNGQVGSCKQR
ncbi:MAG: hypothetical protein ACHQJ6_06535 [Candidatus Berkiellales bacterium]